MKGWKKIKREEDFSKKVKQLSNAWFDYNDLRCLWDKDLGFAESWKPQLYSLQRDAAAALIYSYSNRHPGYGHKAIRTWGRSLFLSLHILHLNFSNSIGNSRSGTNVVQNAINGATSSKHITLISFP